MLTQSQTQNKYVKQWKVWINRNRKFTPDELEELETFLLDKIEDLQETNKLSDKEAFFQALDIMGEQGMLDEEFGKIRRSKFDKVKLWACLQTILSVGLIVLIVVPYIHLPKKEILDPFVGERIGTIDSWMKENKISNIVTSQKSVYFFNHYLNNILCYQNKDSNTAFAEINFMGTYFNLKQDKYFNSQFDVDSQNKLYIWNEFNNWGGLCRLDIYSDSTLKESINLSE